MKRFVRRCFRCFSSQKKIKLDIKEPVLERQSLHNAPTDVYLVCDTNLIIDYQWAVRDDPRGKRISGWREYADKVAARGET